VSPLREEELDALDELMRTLPGDVGTGWAPRDPDCDWSTLTVRVHGVESQQTKADDAANRVRLSAREWCSTRSRMKPPRLVYSNDILRSTADLVAATRGDLVDAQVTDSDLDVAFPARSGRPTRACVAARERVVPVIAGARGRGRSWASIAEALGRPEQQVRRLHRNASQG
jgi:hypothetical protein